MVVLPAPERPVNQRQNPRLCRGGWTSRSTRAISGRVNHAGRSSPAARASRTAVPESEAVARPAGTRSASS